MTRRMSTRNELISDLLMGAAFADQRLDGNEYQAVKRALAQAMGVADVPPVLAARLEWFDPADFDPARTAAELQLETDVEKRQLLELVASVSDADQVLDLDEDGYLRRVAQALGLPPELYADLVIQDLSVESVREAGVALLGPPPLPKPSRKPPPLPSKS
jgi:uncharacterized tellurite resistance protein B-like protein